MKPLLTKEEIADLLAPLASASTTSHAEQQNIDPLPDQSLHVRVTVDNSRMSLQKMLPLKEGALLPIDALTDEPLQLFSGNHLIARGVFVQDGSKLAIKVTTVLVQSESPDKQEL